MKIRTCDKCKKEIKGDYIKCCLSKIENKKYTLNHVGDICFNCWDSLK